MNAACETRARVVSRLTQRVWFHALLTRRSLPLSRRAKHHSVPDRQRTALAIFTARNLFFFSPPSDSFRERRRDPLRQNAHSIIPCDAAPAICGDTPLFFFPFSLFPSCLSTATTVTLRAFARDLWENISDLFTRNGSVVGH